MGVEQPASFYNGVYELKEEYKKHYEESPYYTIWKIILTHFPEDENSLIVDLGCGPGQFAGMVYDEGYKRYIGIDFSGVAIAQAQRRMINKNGFAFAFGNLETCKFPDADIYLLIEVLEHIKNDIEILKKIPVGKQVIVSVPDFDYVAHVRYFQSIDSARERYDKILEIETIEKYGRLFIVIAKRRKEK